MAKTKVVLHNAAFAQLRRLPAVQAEVKRRAEQVAEAAGDGYEVLVNEERTARFGVTVLPSTSAAKRREARDHPLLGALGAGRG